MAVNSCPVTAKQMATDTHSRLYQSRSSTAFVTRRPRHTVPSSASCPSFTLLSILGTIAASCSNVNASPAPPTFLCPSFDPNHSSFAVIDTGAEGALSLPTKRTGTLAGVPRSLPDQYKPDSDGVWRKVERYTLYGSTVCPVCPLYYIGMPPQHLFFITDLRDTLRWPISGG